MKLLMENWRKFLVESQEADVVSKIDAVLGTHPSGRKYNPIFEEPPSLEEDDGREGEGLDVEEIKNAITEDSLREFLERYGKGNLAKSSFSSSKTKYFPIEEIDRKSLDFLIYRSIVLFTGGSVEAVRQPEKYDPEKAKSPIQYYVDKPGVVRATDSFIPSRQLYQIANHTMTSLAKMRNQELGIIYRGMNLSDDEFGELKENVEFNNLSISSWTRSYDVAQYFSFGMVPKKLVKPKKVVFMIEKAEYGAYIARMSAFPAEEEFVLGKKVKIDKIDTTKDNVLSRESREGEIDAVVFCSIIP